MPEILTKHPDVVLKLLHDAHIQCGNEAEPKILKNCPKQNFCSLPTGELCVYGVKDISKMQQLTPLDVFFSFESIMLFSAVIAVAFFLGIILGIKIK